jgi:hypothetical protein
MNNEKRTPKNKAVSVAGKLVEENMKLLENDPEFMKLCSLVPKALEGKESGKDFYKVTNDSDLFERKKDGGTIFLSKSDWDKYEEFGRLCEKLAKKYKLHWVAVEDLAMGVIHPLVAPRLSEIITGNLDPIVYRPKDFDSSKHYVAECEVVPPLDTTTKDEIRAYLHSIVEDTVGCRIAKLREVPLNKKGGNIEINILLKVPVGYTAQEVANEYRKIDNKRREILASLGISIARRRRQSKNLMDGDLKLNENNVNIYEIIDKKFEDETFPPLGQDKLRRKSIINKRYEGKKLLKRRLQDQ